MKRVVLVIMAFLIFCPVEVKATGWTTEKLNAYFSGEPSLRDLQKAALKFFMVNPKRLHSLRKKAANKAWMPVVQAGFTGNMAQSTRAMELAQYRNAYTHPWEDETQINMGYQFSVRATWNLPQLVFNAEELDVASMVGIQDGVLKEITRLYFIRRRLQINLLISPPKDVKTKVMLDLRLQELTGLLDAMTNGYLSKELESAEEAAKKKKAEKSAARMREAVKNKEITPSAKGEKEKVASKRENKKREGTATVKEKAPKENKNKEKLLSKDR